MEPMVIIIWLIMGIAAAIIHKRKGFSYVTGFLWGFLFSWLGLLIVILEKNKEEHDLAKENGEKSIGYWLIRFVIGGTALIVLALIIMAKYIGNK